MRGNATILTGYLRWCVIGLLWGIAGLGSATAQSLARINISSTVPVSNILPADPALAKRGDNAGYTGHALLAGSGFSAEVWFGPLGSRECDLILLPGSRTTFKTGASAGQIVDILNVGLQGFTPGSRVRLQLRAWNNQNGTISSWAQASLSSTVAHGSSAPFDSAALGGLFLFPTPNLTGLQRFNLHTGDSFFQPSAISRQPASRTDCAGGTAQFFVEASGETPLSFQWFRNGVAVAGQTDSALFVAATASENGSSYFVDVANSVCSIRSATAVLTVDSTFNFFSNFNQGIAAAGAVNSGNASWQQAGGVGGGGALSLVGADNNLTGWYSISPFFNAPVQQFQITFKSFIGFKGITPTEGFSVNVSPTTAAVAPLPSGHEGQDNGITIAFDTFNTGGVKPPEAPAIDIKYLGRVIASQPMNPVLNRFADVAITMSPAGRLDVSYDGQLIHKGVLIEDLKHFRSFFNLGAATGSANFARYHVDDLCITAAPNSPPTITSPGNQTIAEDGTTGRLAFQAFDAETLPTDLVVTARSSNTALIPNGNLELFATANSRFVQATPLPDRFGVTTINFRRRMPREPRRRSTSRSPSMR